MDRDVKTIYLYFLIDGMELMKFGFTKYFRVRNFKYWSHWSPWVYPYWSNLVNRHGIFKFHWRALKYFNINSI